MGRFEVAEASIADLRAAMETGQVTSEGLLAACVQHEIDHLDGVLFIDHLSRLKRDMIVRKALKELRQSAASSGRG